MTDGGRGAESGGGQAMGSHSAARGHPRRGGTGTGTGTGSSEGDSTMGADAAEHGVVAVAVAVGCSGTSFGDVETGAGSVRVAGSGSSAMSTNHERDVRWHGVLDGMATLVHVLVEVDGGCGGCRGSGVAHTQRLCGVLRGDRGNACSVSVVVFVCSHELLEAGGGGETVGHLGGGRRLADQSGTDVDGWRAGTVLLQRAIDSVRGAILRHAKISNQFFSLIWQKTHLLKLAACVEVGSKGASPLSV